ncbi:DUF1684 domain-containing protein [Zafaria sp. Z1313]|uniref:DUF1684 domain-containing protein n=1 Tax=unclassified Zafaria TaxID=2828765 RepID=UPI002E768231|nr:DUF1684 domain-containing protein [Zafaria sp. J156]MEE1622679.1 DUF1684 domain-containing protein [Zafaria sp. J156]
MSEIDTWKQWRRLREEGLAVEFGWLTLSSYQWLPPEPGPVEFFPGRFGGGPGGAVYVPDPAQDAVVEYDAGTPVTAPLARALGEGASVFWLRHGGTLVELGLRDGRYMIRTREQHHPALESFHGVPVFDYDPAWVLAGRFEPYEAERTESIGSYRADLRLTATAVGDVVFEAGGRSHRLAAEEGADGSLVLNFHDGTNGDSTADWRFLSVPAPAPDGLVVLDFNRTLNYPFAFSRFAACPMPLHGNRLELAVTAGERIPVDGDHIAQDGHSV